MQREREMQMGSDKSTGWRSQQNNKNKTHTHTVVTHKEYTYTKVGEIIGGFNILFLYHPLFLNTPDIPYLYTKKSIPGTKYILNSPRRVRPSQVGHDGNERDRSLATAHLLHHAHRHVLAQRVHRDHQIRLVVLDHRPKPLVALQVSHLLRGNHTAVVGTHTITETRQW